MKNLWRNVQKRSAAAGLPRGGAVTSHRVQLDTHPLLDVSGDAYRPPSADWSMLKGNSGAVFIFLPPNIDGRIINLELKTDGKVSDEPPDTRRHTCRRWVRSDRRRRRNDYKKEMKLDHEDLMFTCTKEIYLNL
ncbi:Hypothetical predicted protein [Scomber scombrus]|uniref:Uncharacterized protein n=1 Tax=Scomber scombrus TaxID=13677 RepID=A0AAV1PL45_SCOSC